MAFSLVANAVAYGQTNATTSSINTTGADFIVIVASSYSAGPGTVTDSKSNTWTSLTASDATDSNRARIWYCVAPTVGSGHTFSVSGVNVYASLSVTAWSGAASSSTFDVENGATSGNSTTLSTGSVTPSNDNSLLVYGASYATTNNTSSVDVGTLQHAQAGVSGAAYGVGMGYQIQTSATARNPQFTFSGTVKPAARIAVFKAASTGITINCGVGNAAAAGVAATISTAQTITCAVGNAAAAGVSAGVSTAQTIACAIGNAAAAGVSASIALGSDITIDCAVGNAVAAGITAGISTAQAIVCAVGNVAAAGVTASIELGGVISIDCTVGNATASGVAATIDGANAAVVSAVSGGGGPVRRRRHSRLDTPTRDQLDELVQAQREAMGILPKPARNRIRAAVEKEAKRADPSMQSLAPTVASVAKAFDVPASNVADAARRAFEFRIAMQASQEALALIDQRDRDRRQEAARVEIEVRRRHQQKQEDARAHMARLVQDDETLIEQMNGLQREVVGVLLTLREQLRALIPTQA